MNAQSRFMVVSPRTERYFSPPSVVTPSNDFVGFSIVLFFDHVVTDGRLSPVR